MSTVPDGEPHRHHFVPRAFLKLWRGSDHQLSHIYKAYGKTHCRRVGTKGIAHEEDLYNLRDLGISPAVMLALFDLESKFGRPIEYNFEKTLMGEIDSRGSIAHKTFLSDPNAPSDEAALYDLLRFIFVLGARNPHFLERFQFEVIDHLESLLVERGLEHSPLLNVDDLRRDLNAAKITVIEAVLNEDGFRRKYDGMAAFLYDTDPDPVPFVTADIPYFAYPGKNAPLHLVPLSPRRCLVMSKDEQLIRQVSERVNGNFPAFVNFALISYADNVYAADCRERENSEQHLGLLKTDPSRANNLLFHRHTLAMN